MSDDDIIVIVILLITVLIYFLSIDNREQSLPVPEYNNSKAVPFNYSNDPFNYPAIMKTINTIKTFPDNIHEDGFLKYIYITDIVNSVPLVDNECVIFTSKDIDNSVIEKSYKIFIIDPTFDIKKHDSNKKVILVTSDRTIKFVGITIYK